MRLARVKQLAGMTLGFRNFVRNPIGYQDAADAVRARLSQREQRFLEAARRLIYDVPSSPYRRLLAWAGCDYGDLAASTKSYGIETTLERLRDAGVYISLDEFKSRVPILRPGLNIETREKDFDADGGGSIAGHTSGSNGKSTRVAYSWEFIAEEAANELLLYTMHGVQDAPTALWYPMPPGAAGLHNVLMNVGWGKPPEKWFSHSRPEDAGTSREARLALQFLHWSSRAHGTQVPFPEFADTLHAARVVQWMAETKRRHGSCVVRTFGSSAIRIAQTAIADGMDLSGCTIFVGGEPLTEHRRQFIESAGLRVIPRYVITETGLVAAACPNRGSADEMHLYTDRLALIQAGTPENSYLFTTLTPHLGRVVFNTMLGDFGTLTRRQCGCLFGNLGFDTHVSGVRSADKVTIEGMTLFASELDEIIGAVVAKMGGHPDSYQFQEIPIADGLTGLVIVISPEVNGVDEQVLIHTILDRLEKSGPRTALASHFLRQASSIRIVRERPKLTGGHKRLAAVRERNAAPASR